MEETSTDVFTAPAATPTDVFTPAPTPTYTDPISSFFGGIFFIIILFLLIVIFVVIVFARALGLVKDAPAQPPAVKKEGFKDGPPYPSCRTNGSFATF
jgi:hypothetical protein